VLTSHNLLNWFRVATQSVTAGSCHFMLKRLTWLKRQQQQTKSIKNRECSSSVLMSAVCCKRVYSTCKMQAEAKTSLVPVLADAALRWTHAVSRPAQGWAPTNCLRVSIHLSGGSACQSERWVMTILDLKVIFQFLFSPTYGIRKTFNSQNCNS